MLFVDITANGNKWNIWVKYSAQSILTIYTIGLLKSDFVSTSFSEMFCKANIPGVCFFSMLVVISSHHIILYVDTALCRVTLLKDKPY